MYLKKILLILLLLPFALQLTAQDDMQFIVDGRLTSDDGKTDGATITISMSGKADEVISPPRTGRFLFKLDFNREYRLTFNREGFFQKIIIVSTYVPTEILQKNNKFPPLSFVLNLFKETDIIDNSFTIKPVARVFYNAKIDNFDSEIYLSDDQIKEQIQAAEEANSALASERKNIGRADELEHAALEKRYDKAIADADALYQKNNYDGAVSKFREALMLFSDRPYPRDRIAEIQDLMLALKMAEETEQNYLAAIQSGDNQFAETQYSGAIAAYQKALQYKAKDKYATQRIEESNKLMKEQMGNMQYNELIAKADQAFNGDLFDQAKGLYQQAVDLRPRDSQYARDQISKIDLEVERLAKLKQLNEQYAEAMSKGNTSFAAEAFPAALSSFKLALSLKPADEEALGRIDATEAAMETLANNQKYTELISKADELFDKEQLLASKDFYTQALALKTTEQYPKDRIAQIDSRIQFNQQFDQLLAEANTSFTQKEYTLAKGKYQQILQLKADHELSQNRLIEIDGILNQMASDEQYNAAIELADQGFTAKQYQSAKINYQKASSLKPAESYPNDQILKIDQELARLAQLDEDYKKAVGEGDRLGSEKNYPDAIQQYQLALNFRPEASYPTEQIARMKQLQADLQQANQLNRSYQTYISKADSLLTLKDYRNSRANYTDAKRLKPEEQYPAEKISEIDAILAELDRQNEVQAKVTLTYQAALRRGDEALKEKDYAIATDAYNEAHLLKQDEQYPVKQLAEIERLQAFELEQAYKAAITKADALFRKEELASAKPVYQEALNIKSADQYAIDQIALIDQKMQQLAQADADRQKLEAEYAAKIAEADQAFSSKIYLISKSLYQEALTLKPQEKYPAGQILKIEDLLKQQEQLAILDQQYQEAIASAKAAFNQDQLPEAISAYKQAGSLKPNEPEPPQRISEIEQLIAQRAEEARLAAEAEAQRIAAENAAKATKASYNEAIALGDAAMSQKSYAQAQTAYNKALSFFPDEQYPKDQLNEIERLLQRLAQAELERKQKAREDSIAEANLLAFNLKIKEAETFIDKQQLEQALRSYRDAIVILPVKEPDVQPKIKELEDLIAQIAEVDADYRAAIVKADEHFEAEAWNEAKATYQLALNMKPQEAYPKKQIEAIDLKLTELELLAERAKAAEKTNETYNEAIQVADENFNKLDYTVAQFYYQKASNIQPQNPYPKQRLAEISRLIDQSLAADKIKAYNDAITKADTEFDRKGYTLARFYYNKALEIKSWEKYPQDRISEISKLTNTMLSQREEQDYLNWINIADEAFVNKDFAVARAYYQRALALKKEEPYPSIRMAEIQQELEKSLAQQSEKEYLNAIAEGDKAFENKNYSVARFYYNKAIGIKPNEKYPKDQIQLIRSAVGGN